MQNPWHTALAFQGRSNAACSAMYAVHANALANYRLDLE